MPGFTLEHLGIAVSDAAEAIALFEKLLGAKPYKVEIVEREGVRTYFLGDGAEVGAAPKLELLEALNDESPIARFIEKRGPGLHHVAFEVADIKAEMARLASLGFQLLSDEPKPGADDKSIVFLHPKSTGGVLVELCQSVEQPPQKISVPFNSGELATFVSGPEDAPPLVVLHAALGSTEMEMRRLTRLWEKDFRVYALDFMAHGDSDPFPSQELSLERFAENVITLLDSQDIPKAHLFGFSMGGSVALNAAYTYPDRFDRLSIHAHNVQWSELERDTMVGTMQSALDDPMSFWSKRLSQTHGAAHWRDLVERMIAFTTALPKKRFAVEELETIEHPTLVSTGDRDHFFGLGHSLMLHAALPNASLAVVPGSGHTIQTVTPESFTKMVTKYLLG